MKLGGVVLAVLVLGCGDPTVAPPGDTCTERVFYADRDGDGFGDATDTIQACVRPAGYAANSADCDDACSTCHPEGTEVCDGALDQDCDGSADEGCACVSGTTTACPNGSDVGLCRSGTQDCVDGVFQECIGRVEPVDETCNGEDDDCDGAVDGPVAVEACGEAANAATIACDGACVVASCEPGFDDCNTTFADGCEADLGTAATCAACSTTCDPGLACEQGACIELPRFVWAKSVIGGRLDDAALLDGGDVIVAGSQFETSVITVDAASLAPDGISGNLYLLRLAEDGAVRFLVRDGASTISAMELAGLLRVDQPNDRLVVGCAWDGVDARLAGTLLDDGGDPFIPSRDCIAVYRLDGTPRWARPVPELYETGLPLDGPFGVDVFGLPILANPGPRMLFRFDAAGARRDLALPPISSFTPVLQTGSGATVGLAQHGGGLTTDCTRIDDGIIRSYLLTVSPGSCEALEIAEGSLNATIQRRPDGGLLVAGMFRGTLVMNGFTTTVIEDTSIVIAMTAGGLVEWAHQASSGSFEAVADGVGNVYWLRVGVLESFRPDGVARWSTPITGGLLQLNRHNLSVNAAGEIVLALTATGNVTIGSTVIPGQGQRDVIVKLEGR